MSGRVTRSVEGVCLQASVVAYSRFLMRMCTVHPTCRFNPDKKVECMLLAPFPPLQHVAAKPVIEDSWTVEPLQGSTPDTVTCNVNTLGRSYPWLPTGLLVALFDVLQIVLSVPCTPSFVLLVLPLDVACDDLVSSAVI